jgi:hypothetical protein
MASLESRVTALEDMVHKLAFLAGLGVECGDCGRPIGADTTYALVEGMVQWTCVSCGAECESEGWSG